MGAIGVHHTETSEGGWDGPANEARLNADGTAAYYRRAFAWQDPEGDPETKAAYRFIHHEVSGDGTIGAANLRAASTGIGVLNGGRGGTTIPAGDRRGVYNHLAAHLKDADKEVPELKSSRQDAKTPGDSEVERRVSVGALEVRESADGGAPVIAGYAAVFNQWSEDLGGFVERIEPGFFAPVLGSDVRALWQHDPAHVLGRTTNGTLRLAEDATGLAVEIHPPLTGWATDALVSLRRGDVSGMSFGFTVDEDRWMSETKGPAQRTLVRAKELYDVSPVTFPAYPQTSVSVRQHLADLRAEADGAGEDNVVEDLTRAREDLKRRIKIRQREV